MLIRSLFNEDDALFRNSVRRFLAAQIVPQHAAWEKAGSLPRETWRNAGEAGLLCCEVPERYGGAGGTFLHSVIVIEEIARSGASGAQGFFLHSDYFAPYLLAAGTEAQKTYWLPRMARGETITAIALTEPDAGSDLQGIRTSARRDGEEWVISGAKTYISNGQLADLLIVAAKTDPKPGGKAMSLFLVEGGRSGFVRGRCLEKIGLKAQDTSELFFNDVRVPAANLVGAANCGFRILMQQLARERLCQAVRSCAVAEAVLEDTIEYVRDRRAFGQRVADFQNSQFVIARLQTKVWCARAFVDYCIGAQLRGELDPVIAAAAKLQLTELHFEVTDECLQLHGGAGYMWESSVARAFVDARVTRITGGTSEIMKQIIGRRILAATP